MHQPRYSLFGKLAVVLLTIGSFSMGGCYTTEEAETKNEITQETEQAIVVDVYKVRRMDVSSPGLIVNFERWENSEIPTSSTFSYVLPEDIAAVDPNFDLGYYYDPGDPENDPPIPPRCQDVPF